MHPALDTIHAYYAAFSALEMDAIVSYYSEPTMTVSRQGVFSAPTRAALADFLAPMLDGLRAKGYGRSEFIEPHTTALGEADAIVRGIAVRYTARGPELERLPISYLMHRGATGWKIATLIAEM